MKNYKFTFDVYGFDISMLKAVCGAVKITLSPASSLFHFKELTVEQVKADCRGRGITVRI